MEQGKLVVISGFSGAGKGTIMKALLKKYPDYALSISVTSRKPRAGEIDGVDYFFITVEQFKEMIEKEQLIEYAQYVENYYGTPKEYVDEQRKLGKNVLLEIEIQGALKIKQRFPDTLLMFVCAPSADELKNRLVGRGTESEDVCRQRLSRAYEESLGIENYDYLVVNDEIDKCVELVDDIIKNDGLSNKNDNHRISSNIDFIKEMKNELLSFSKGE